MTYIFRHERKDPHWIARLTAKSIMAIEGQSNSLCVTLYRASLECIPEKNRRSIGKENRRKENNDE